MTRIETLIHNAMLEGLTPASAKTLWENQNELLMKQATPEFNAKKEEILDRHGFSEKEWKEILNAATSFYFSPSEKMDSCNREIKQLCKQFNVHNPCYERNYLYACLSNSKSKHVHREKIGGIWHYSWVD